MANGRPGDNWFTDVVSHHMPTLSTEADRLVVAIAALSPEPGNETVMALVEEHLARARQRRVAGGQPTAYIESKLQPDELGPLEDDLRRLLQRLQRP